MPEIKIAEFIGAFSSYASCPTKNDFKEFAFIGRSNVGKSSLINFITGKKDLVKVSNTPGKTQSVNMFEINKAFTFIDLPGYGYARRSKSTRGSFSKMVYDYLEFREQLHCTFALIDSRVPPQAIDLQFIEWLGEKGVPFVIVFTKSDKRERKESAANISKFKQKMLENWEELPPIFITSTSDRIGKEDLLAFIDEQL